MIIKVHTSSCGLVRYTDVRKRIILGILHDYFSCSESIGNLPNCVVKVDKKTVNIQTEIELLYNILVLDFGLNIVNFDNVFSRANFYVADNSVEKGKRLLVLFDSLLFDITSSKFYTITITSNRIILPNAIPYHTPFFYPSGNTTA